MLFIIANNKHVLTSFVFFMLERSRLRKSKAQRQIQANYINSESPAFGRFITPIVATIIPSDIIRIRYGFAGPRY